MTLNTIKKHLEKAREDYEKKREEADRINPYFKNKKAEWEHMAKEAKKQVKHWEEILKLKIKEEEKSAIIDKLPNTIIDSNLEKQLWEKFKDFVDIANKKARKNGFKNLSHWADSAYRRGVISEEQKLKCVTYKKVRDNDSHGGAGEFSAAEIVIENLNGIIEIIQNDTYRYKRFN